VILKVLKSYSPCSAAKFVRGAEEGKNKNKKKKQFSFLEENFKWHLEAFASELFNYSAL